LKKNSFSEAKRYLVGGVNSPVRAFKAVGGEPFLVASGKGSRLYDGDGNAYLDYVMSWGANILGHAAPEIVSAINRAAGQGISFGAPTWSEAELARMIREAFPSMEKVRLVSSGTEAVMSAVRLARGATGRKKIVKFIGGYHGHADGFLVKAGSGGATFGIPDSKGVPEEVARLTLAIPYNHEEEAEKIFKAHGDEIACVLAEPVAANMGVVVPEESFLQKLRDLCNHYGALLVFDEVITGFRIAYGGAQELFGIEADLTCLGKILGGGLPLAAFGGRDEIMCHLAPEGPVYQAGTLSGNPLAVACGIAVLNILRSGEVYRELARKSESLLGPLSDYVTKKSYPVRIRACASLFTVFFAPDEIRNFSDAQKSDTEKYAAFFHGLLKQGVFFPPSQFESCFISRGHSSQDLSITLDAVRKSLEFVFK